MNKTQSSVNNALKNRAAKAPAKAKDGDMAHLVRQMGPRIKNALLGTALQPERFTSQVLSTLSNNPKLQACDPTSFLAAMMSSAQLGLEPNTPLGQAYLIPFGKQCTFILGYRGLIELAYRSGKIKKIDAETVYENDEFEYELGWDAKLVHKPAFGDRGKPIGYYALFKLDDGGGNFLFMSKEDVDKHANKFSKSYGNGPWRDDFDSMAKKTVLRQLLKYAPINVEAAQGLAADESVKHMDVNSNINILDVEPVYDVDPNTGEVREAVSDNVSEIKEELGQESFTQPDMFK